MVRKVEESSSVWEKLFVLLFLVVFFWLVWFFFFSYNDCRDSACFEESLKGCDRAKFISGDDMIFEYIIRGESGDECEVDVRLLQGELDNADSMKLEGQRMTCMLPLGAVVVPESDIGACHGLLKEGLQDLVIRKLHSYLVQNLGRLNLEMVDIPKV